ncbi:ubiquinol-cytochrome c reductase iron-sulfur subunit [Thermodesulfobacteriota bacterium]
MKQTDKSTDSPSRRSFLNKIWICLGIVAVIELIAVIIGFLGPGKSRKTTDKSGIIITAGQADKFPVNSVTANIKGRFYLCRLGDGGFLAVSSKCTHLGCTVPWVDEEKRFACPCHGSSFDIKGSVISSPAARPLDIYSVTIENNVVKVDISKRIKREKFFKDQVVYAKKVMK